MARRPLLQLNDMSLSYGGDPLFSDVSLTLHPGERLALVGRNGSGKSTLMKVLAGIVEPDTGEVVTTPGIRAGYMEQDPDLSRFATLGDFAISALGPGELYRVERAAEGLKFNPDTAVSAASGGERRRAALAKLLAEEPDLMLLDEPTNHLDIEAIAWLEDMLGAARSGFVLISHDRAFLTALTRATLWVDRGVLRRQDKGFADFEAWRDRTWEEEDLARHKLDRKIKAEARWAVEGISARRKRNQGRVRALAALRQERAAMIRRKGNAGMALDTGKLSGKLVIEASNINKSFDQPVIKDFSLRILRGDRIAFVGPNGAGKTSLLRILTGEIPPDSGTVRHGTNLTPAIFDQNRAQLNPDATLWESLTLDPMLAAQGRSDQVMVRGSPRHVVGYLKEFLFDDAQARAPVRSLSGGEKARLLLARVMARQSNLLVLDEPTNDLDVETLDLLQDILDGYDGTVMLVSHDRDFLDRVATNTLVFEGAGRITHYAGGWSDYQAQRRDESAPTTSKRDIKTQKKKDKTASSSADGLTFTEQHRLDELPDIIARLEAEITKLSDYLSDPELYATAPLKFAKATEALSERQTNLAAAEEEWLSLAEKAEQ